MQDRYGARILVVDDESVSRGLLSRWLRGLGYKETATAADGHTALEMIATKPFDVVLLDVMMPGLTGVEVLERLRREKRLEDMPVIMISASTEFETAVRCIELGAEDYLPKPFNPVLLRTRLASVIDKKLLRDALRSQLSRLEDELAEARRQQLNMMPRVFPTGANGGGVDIHAVMLPAREVGGDLYDAFEVSPGIVCIAVGDVSGKGMPAALFMARTRSLLRAGTLQYVGISGKIPQSSRVVELLNDELCKDNADCMFITLFLGFLEIETGILTYTNAGHVRPYVLRAQTGVERLDSPPELPLGMVSDAPFSDATLRLGPGDGLVILSDGLPETMNGAGEFYTLDRVVADLVELADANPRDLTTALVERIVGFGGDAAQNDDVTALALRRTRRPETPS